MTSAELRDMIETVVESAVERKLLDLLGDSDEGLPLRKRVRDRLQRQRQDVATGERGRSFREVVGELGLE
ncbi:MAG: hypothetical protein ACREJB_11770 [Planctomycetaceae bacterium]